MSQKDRSAYNRKYYLENRELVLVTAKLHQQTKRGDTLVKSVGKPKGTTGGYKAKWLKEYEEKKGVQGEGEDKKE